MWTTRGPCTTSVYQAPRPVDDAGDDDDSEFPIVAVVMGAVVALALIGVAVAVAVFMKMKQRNRNKRMAVVCYSNFRAYVMIVGLITTHALLPFS